MKRIMKSSLIFLVMGFSLNSYSATIPAQTFSRANCKVYIHRLVMDITMNLFLMIY